MTFDTWHLSEKNMAKQEYRQRNRGKDEKKTWFAYIHEEYVRIQFEILFIVNLPLFCFPEMISKYTTEATLTKLKYSLFVWSIENICPFFAIASEINGRHMKWLKKKLWNKEKSNWLCGRNSSLPPSYLSNTAFPYWKILFLRKQSVVNCCYIHQEFARIRITICYLVNTHIVLVLFPFICSICINFLSRQHKTKKNHPLTNREKKKTNSIRTMH